MLSKTLQISDYQNLFPYTEKIRHYKSNFGDLTRFEHEHRLWEYSLVYKAITEAKNPIKTILIVGEGGTVMLPLLTMLRYDVLGIDPDYNLDGMKQLEMLSKLPLKYQKKDFFDLPTSSYDAVVCTSVLEHVQNHQKFFNKLLDFSTNLVCLTVDFLPSGEAPLYPNHLRTYNSNAMVSLISKAEKKGFYPVDGYDYSVFEPNVNGCTFASLILEKKSLDGTV